MNNCTNVNPWQDDDVTEHSTTSPEEPGAAQTSPGETRPGQAGPREAGQPDELRTVTTVAELKALADPLRLAILDALTGGAAREMRVLSVKELAAELGEPKTKLYRHIKLLEAAGLIRVAATRLVSGIVEQRYQACQVDLVIGRRWMREPGGEDETRTLVEFTLDRYRRRYLDYLASMPSGGPPSEDRSMLTYKASMVSPARARIIQDKLREAEAELGRLADLDDDADSDSTVQIELLLSYMTTD